MWGEWETVFLAHLAQWLLCRRVSPRLSLPCVGAQLAPIPGVFHFSFLNLNCQSVDLPRWLNGVIYLNLTVNLKSIISEDLAHVRYNSSSGYMLESINRIISDHSNNQVCQSVCMKNEMGSQSLWVLPQEVNQWPEGCHLLWSAGSGQEDESWL